MPDLTWMRSANLLAGAIALTALTSPGEAAGSHRVFNVTAYGATGNGTTDDTAAIQAAVTAAGSNSGNVVFFPAGSYLITGTVNVSGLTLQGQGATVVASGATGEIFVTGTDSTIQNLNFKGVNPSIASTPLFLKNSTNATVSGCTFTGNFAFGMALQFCNGLKVTGNTFSIDSSEIGEFWSQSTGEFSNNTITATNGANRVTGLLCGLSTITISGNNFNGPFTNTITSVAVSAASDTNLVIESNKLNGWGVAVASKANNGVSINGNTVTNSVLAAISSGADSGVTISNNTVTNVAQFVGITLSGNIGLATVKNNQVSNTGSAAILAQFGPYPGGGNLTISGNALSNAGLVSHTNLAVIYTNQAAASAVIITGNQYKGNTQNLSYFIDALQPSPVSQVSGNKTNTLLPTKVGP